MIFVLLKNDFEISYNNHVITIYNHVQIYTWESKKIYNSKLEICLLGNNKVVYMIECCQTIL